MTVPDETDHDTRGIREVLGSVAFWTVVAYFVLAFVVVWLFFVTGQRRRDSTLHRGEVIADARSKVNQCIQSRAEIARIDSFVYAVLRFHIAAYENSKATFEATPKNDPQRRVREENAERIRVTIKPVADTSFPVPTIDQCLLIGHTRYGIVKPTVPITRVRIPKKPKIPADAVRP